MAPKLQHAANFEDLAKALSKVAEDTQRSTLVSQLALRNCTALNDDALCLLLDALPTLAAVDVARCEALGDAAMRRIAQHQPETRAVRDARTHIEGLGIRDAQVRDPLHSRLHINLLAALCYHSSDPDTREALRT